MDSKIILKNTVFLYIRMFFTMGITLYTSRVILNTLGLQDYGIYSVVSGIVTLFGFFSSAMSSATQRFLSFDIGRNDMEQLKKTFNAALNIHIMIGILILALAETFGLWFVNNKLNLASERMVTVNWVYQFSIFTFFLGVIQVPYDALIIAREKMGIYAIMSFIEVILKLIIVYLLIIFSFDKLRLYAGLVFLVAFIVRIVHKIHCKIFYPESRYQFYFEKELYQKLIAYSGWNLFGNIGSIARGQGINVILNLFFGTILNAAYGITFQVHTAVSLFVGNFQVAINPQIIKNYAQGNIEQTKKLIFKSAKFSYFLMFIIICPFLFNVDFVLKLWLETPSQYTSIFVNLCLINLLIDCISGPLMIGTQAAGNIKWYQIIDGILIFLNLPISYFLLKRYNMPELVYYTRILISIIALVFRLYFLSFILGFSIKLFFRQIISKILLVSGVTIVLVWLFKSVVHTSDGWLPMILQSLVIISIIFLSIVFLGINKNEYKFINYSLRKSLISKRK